MLNRLAVARRSGGDILAAPSMSTPSPPAIQNPSFKTGNRAWLVIRSSARHEHVREIYHKRMIDDDGNKPVWASWGAGVLSANNSSKNTTIDERVGKNSCAPSGPINPGSL